MDLAVENIIARDYYGEEGAIDVIADAGFDAIDYNVCGLSPEAFTETIEKKGVPYAKELKAHAEEKGVYFCQSHAIFDYRFGIGYDVSDRKFYEVVKSLEFSAALGAPVSVVHCLPHPDEKTMMEENFKFYSALLPYAEEYGIAIGVENLWSSQRSGQRLDRSSRYNEMIDRLDSPFAKGCFDIGHANISMHCPQEFIRDAGSRIFCLHVHDNDGNRDMHMPPSTHPNSNCNVDWNEVISSLSAIDYRGVFSLELVNYMGMYSAELLPEALRLAAAAGRTMIQRLENAR
ncbi:MAG: sugar phosphate isomerase/epimerase [Atopobiaceae bacterium]|nr:sugar phosphate isomerase/epimerase [Atopobiaceae bacterium]